MTFNQKIKSKPVFKQKKSKTPRLEKCPQKKGVCQRVFVLNPKKPNSASRKATKVWLNSTKRAVIVYIPGIGHNLQKFSTVLIRGGRIKDLPGVRYQVIRGKYDSRAVANRYRARSRYGIKSTKLKKNKNFKWKN